MSKIEMPGDFLFALSYEEIGDNQRKYHILYNPDDDDYNGVSQLSGAIYKLMNEYPNLIEDFLYVSNLATQELSETILNTLNNDKKNQT